MEGKRQPKGLQGLPPPGCTSTSIWIQVLTHQLLLLKLKVGVSPSPFPRPTIVTLLRLLQKTLYQASPLTASPHSPSMTLTSLDDVALPGSQGHGCEDDLLHGTNPPSLEPHNSIKSLLNKDVNSHEGATWRHPWRIQHLRCIFSAPMGWEKWVLYKAIS